MKDFSNYGDLFYTPGISDPFVQKFFDNKDLFKDHEIHYLNQFTDHELATEDFKKKMGWMKEKASQWTSNHSRTDRYYDRR